MKLPSVISWLTMLIASVVAIYEIPKNVESLKSQERSKLYSLNPDALNRLCHRAAVVALLKVKAKSLLSELHSSNPDYSTHQSDYSICSAQSSSAVEHAKCVVRLMDARDGLDGEAKISEGDHSPARTDLVSTLLGGLTAILPKPDRKSPPIVRKISMRRHEQWPNPIDEHRTRLKRRLKAVPDSIGSVNLGRLKRLQRFLDMREFTTGYVRRMSEANSASLKSLLPGEFHDVDYKLTTTEKMNLSLVDDLVNSLSKLRSVPILSPKLFPLTLSSTARKGGLLSPDILGASYGGVGDTPLSSLPTLVEKFTGSGRERDEWVDLLMNITGTAKAIDALEREIGPEIEAMEREIFPAILELSRLDRQWGALDRSITSDQEHQLDSTGYAHLSEEQMRLVYGRQASDNLISVAKLSHSQREHHLERQIRELAGLNARRLKRHVHKAPMAEHSHEVNHTSRETVGYEGEDRESENKILRPWAFSNWVGRPGAVEAVVLSPHAYVSELASPEALILSVLTPRAFISTILSPGALMSRILSPSALRAEVLSPRALAAYILTPEALITEVLTPRFLDARILAPEALIAKVLSPKILAPSVYSPEALGVIVLSPTILSPKVKSGEKLFVEILSPHILSGGEHEDEEEGEAHEHNHGHGEHGGQQGHDSNDHGAKSRGHQQNVEVSQQEFTAANKLYEALTKEALPNDHPLETKLLAVKQSSLAEDILTPNEAPTLNRPISARDNY